MTATNSKRILKSSVWMSMSIVVGKVAQLLSQIILARLLSPDDFGIWAMVLILSNFSILFRDTAIAQVLVQRGLEDKQIVNTVYSLGINISIGLFIVQSLAGFPLSIFFGIPILFPLTAFAALVFLIGAGAGSHTSVMQRQMKFRELAICDGLASFTRVGSAIICAFSGLGVWSFVVGEVAMVMVDSLLKKYLSRYHFTYSYKLDKTAVNDVKKFIIGIVSTSFAVQMNTMSDNVIIGKLLGKQALGYYNLAYQLAMTPVYVLSQVNRVVLSVMSQRDNVGQKLFISQVLELYAIIFAPVYGIAFVIAPWFIPLMYGQDWIESVSLFQILLTFAYTRGIMAILGNTLVALDKPMTNAFINWMLVPITVLSYFIGVNLGGAKGVAIAVALVLGIGATIWFWLAIHHVTRWDIKFLIKPTFLPTLAISISLILALFLPLPDQYITISTQPIILIFSYAILLAVFSSGRIPNILFNTIKLLWKNEKIL
ncbi:oligosaccharide flippase family protein [Nostocaceae cyanobacterium CENA357]|uniref:Oligosaccharide flippase family protein n=1 Tax=Atlanticothrix silvestris CENA357 TaxID=1725252 RepID=A0A8J7KZD7_9CYAN|nr:oligosaccharide flippase family protein [Atlanticothrix silvestris]MBH8552830.1 oligosaccharide flippase family protein [Atlanticothrix silvestris CENA357]